MRQLIFKDKTGKEYLVTENETNIRLHEDGHVILICQKLEEILKLGLKFSHEMPIVDKNELQ